MKFVTFHMTDKSEKSMPMAQALAILNDPKQLCPIEDAEGKWTGECINKAFVIRTSRDIAAERGFAELADAARSIAAPEPEVTEEARAMVKSIGDILKR